jgi:hypothetical protein
MRVCTDSALAVVVLCGLSLLAACGDDSGSSSDGEADAQRVERDGGVDANGDIGLNSDTGEAPGPVDVSDFFDTDTSRPDAVGADVREPRPDVSVGTDTGPGERFRGGVTLFEVRAPGIDALNTGGVGAGFQTWSEPETADRVATVGDCFVTAVAPDSNPFADEPTLDGGTITVTTAVETFTLTVGPTGDGPRYSGGTEEGRSEYYAGGETVSVSSAGGADVQAISGSVRTPEEPVITAPSWSIGSSHSREDDLAVSWSGSASGSVVFVNILPVRLFPDPGIADGNSITCEVDDTGSFTVPAAALAYLPEGGFLGGASVALTVVRSVSSPTTGAGSDVVVNATASHTVIGAVD